jgi:quinol-cytochrome oxidoreductase complex cytochrome b subunit
MPRCPYCRRDLPVFETICQQCLEAGYERVAHPTPWWRRLRLTSGLYSFLFVFIYSYLIAQINRDHHPTIEGFVLLAFIVAAFLILIEVAMRNPGESRAPRRFLYGFLILFVYFFFCFWSVSSYHPIEKPALFALVFATIAGLVESVRTYPARDSGLEKKGAGRFRRPEDHSRDAV